jgi:hypothetical protein
VRDFKAVRLFALYLQNVFQIEPIFLWRCLFCPDSGKKGRGLWA